MRPDLPQISSLEPRIYIDLIPDGRTRRFYVHLVLPRDQAGACMDQTESYDRAIAIAHQVAADEGMLQPYPIVDRVGEGSPSRAGQLLLKRLIEARRVG